MNPLLAVVLAASSAALWGFVGVVIRKYAGPTTVYAGSLITIGVGAVALGGLSLVVSPWSALTLQTAFWFALGGALAPGLAQPLLFLGIRYIGVGRAMPLTTLSPFLSTVIAMAWLGEQPGAAVFLATTCVIAGCVLTSLKPERDADWRRIFISLPIAHALTVALSVSMRRHALAILPDVVLGAAIASMTAVPAMLVLHPFLPPGERFAFDRRGLVAFLLCGIMLSVSFFLHFAAYKHGEVSIVIPVVYTAPLFSLLLARVWLREEEPLTWQKLAGAISLFAGMAIIVGHAA